MDKESRIVIVGAGVFGLTTARELAMNGHRNITVLDRHIPPVPDGSSNDISRVIRFDYADEIYLKIAYDAYQKWSQSPQYRGIFNSTPFILTCDDGPQGQGTSYIQKTTESLTKLKLPWMELPNAAAAKRLAPVLTGSLAGDEFFGYCNHQAGWADAGKAMIKLRDDCIKHGVSFVSGHAGTVIGLETDAKGRVIALRTLAGTLVHGDEFVLAAGAWSSSIVSMYNSTLSTGQIVGYLRLTDQEMEKYKSLPIYINFSKGWFCFPPHSNARMLKMAVHGWGYTRAPTSEERSVLKADVSSPPVRPCSDRPNFVPVDGEKRLHEGLRAVLPELADRAFDRAVLCWYTDTPTGDFIMDYHPDHENLLIAGGGSGHAFKFLPVLGEYTVRALKKQLPPELATKWRFRKEYRDQEDVFKGDGSRGGPTRRELKPEERARL